MSNNKTPLESRRVVVTGIGTISAAGKNLEEFWDSVSTGKQCIGPIGKRWEKAYQSFPGDKEGWIGGEVKNYIAADYFNRRELLLLDLFSQFALVAAKEAVLDSDLKITKDNQDNIAVILGTSTGGDESRDDASYQFYCKKKRISNFTILRTMASAAASHVSMNFGVTGPTYTVQSTCASATHAIGQAFWQIKQGIVDAAITGGTETLPSLGLFKAWQAMRVLAPDTCRPFSKNRKGLVLGEGAGVLVIESLEHALARNAKIYAEITGFGMSSDAKDLVSPSQNGPISAIKMALKSAGYLASDIDYVNAHGTGTPANDMMEISALKAVFGSHAYKLAISSTKSVHGHALGAAGALEAIATILAIQHNLAPPTINMDEIDPTCDLNVVANKPIHLTINKAITNSFGFGGLNGVLAIEKWD